MPQVQQINLAGGPGIRVSQENHLTEGPQTWRPVSATCHSPHPGSTHSARLSAGSYWKGRRSPLPWHLWLDPNTEQRCSRKMVHSTLIPWVLSDLQDSSRDPLSSKFPSSNSKRIPFPHLWSTDCVGNRRVPEERLVPHLQSPKFSSYRPAPLPRSLTRAD